MRKVLALLILASALALNAAAAFAGSANSRSMFYGDGFDNTTCADMPRQHGCV